jgi:hypothetical protein
VLTNEERHSGSMASYSIFPQCLDCQETVVHILQDCEDVRNYWTDLIYQDYWSKFFSSGLQDWLNLKLSAYNIDTIQVNRHYSLSEVAVNDLWKDRNRLVFSRNTVINIMGATLFQLVANHVNC